MKARYEHSVMSNTVRSEIIQQAIQYGNIKDTRNMSTSLSRAHATILFIYIRARDQSTDSYALPPRSMP